MNELSFVKKSKKSEISYLNDYAVFDTETSHIDDISWIYVWGFYFNGQYVQRRTPSDFVSLLNYYQKKSLILIQYISLNFPSCGFE